LDTVELAETSIGNYSDHPPTALTLRMDAANAIDRRRRRLGVMNSSLTILVLLNTPLEAVQIRVEWFELPLN
jgi:hypothetical protein